MRLLLDEITNGSNAGIGRVVELPVEHDGLQDPRRAQSDPAHLVAGNDRWRYRSRRAVKNDGRLRLVVVIVDGERWRNENRPQKKEY